MKTPVPIGLKLIATLIIQAILIMPGNAQEGTLVFKKILWGNPSISSKAPDFIDLNLDKGVVEFTVPHKKDCKERYRFSYEFMQDMSQLLVYKDQEMEYEYVVKMEALDKSCYEYDYYLFRNAWVRAATDASGSSSGLKYVLRKEENYPYLPSGKFINNRSPNIYAHPSKPDYATGVYRGTFKVRSLTANYISSDKTYYSEFYFNISSPSPLGGKTNRFEYSIVFVYELVEGVPEKVSNDPCKIEKPDCSCCPGTIPMWNFDTNKGECVCPEGTVWNKMTKRCEPR